MRETDEDWRFYGEFEPYYGVLTHDRFLRANLTPESLEEFWQSGRADIEEIWGALVHLYGDRRPKRALDFGCGVGRLSRAMATFCDQVVGVDISPAMVAEGQVDAPGNLELTTNLPPGPFDWINSYIVFQHIPPERGYKLLETLLQSAGDSALLSVQFTFFKDSAGLSEHGLDAIRFGTWDGNAVRPLVMSEGVERRMMMYDYDLNQIFAMLVDKGFAQVHLRHTNHGGAHGALILAAR